MTDEACLICGRSADEHHGFEPIPVRPEGCVCDAHTWGNPQSIPPICNAHTGDSDGYCRTCEHDEACHRARRTEREELTDG